MLELIRQHENSKKLYSIDSRKCMRKSNIEEQEEVNHNLVPAKAAKEMKQKAKSLGLKKLNQPGKKKPFIVSTQYKPIPLMLTKKETSVTLQLRAKS